MERLAKLQEYLGTRFFERTEVIEGVFCALGAREHVLLLGPPGTGKSLLLYTLASAIRGARWFAWLLTKFSTPEELFGPVSLKALEQDRYCRIPAGKLPECELAFIDEVFKAGPSVLNLLLTVMNERLFYNDSQPRQVPLISLFGASNELPAGEDETHLAAFADRFLLRYVLSYLSEDGSFAGMMRLDAGQPAVPEAVQVTLQDIEAYQRAAKAVRVAEETLDALVVLRRELRGEGIVVSDRRWRHAVGVLRAKAALAGAAEVSVDRDFDLLCHVLWTSPDQRKPLARVVQRVADPLAQRVGDILEEAEEVYNAALSAVKQAETDNSVNVAASGAEANRKLKLLAAELQALDGKVAAGSKPKVAQALQTVDGYNRDVLRRCLGLKV